jgi:hypothetical protein
MKFRRGEVVGIDYISLSKVRDVSSIPPYGIIRELDEELGKYVIKFLNGDSGLFSSEYLRPYGTRRLQLGDTEEYWDLKLSDPVRWEKLSDLGIPDSRVKEILESIRKVEKGEKRI